MRTLKSTFETQNTSLSDERDKLCSSTQPEATDKQPKVLSPTPEMDQNSELRTEQDEHIANVQETISLRKERIVVLFLGHWKKSTYTVMLKSRNTAERKMSLVNLDMTL